MDLVPTSAYEPYHLSRFQIRILFTTFAVLNQKKHTIMTRMTIDIENWKHIKTKDVLKIVEKGLAELQNLTDNDFDGAKPLDSAHYNDYENSGVVVQYKWNNK